MTDPVLIKIAIVIGIIFAYGLLRWRLMTATHEFRVHAGCEADRLAEDPRVSPDTQATLKHLADMAYGFFTPWLVLLALIVAMLLSIWSRPSVEGRDNSEVAGEISLLKLKLFIALITTSPLACILAVLVLALGLLVRGSVEALASYMAAAGDRFFPGGGTGYSRPA